MIAHAGLIALYTGREWRGVLIEGPSGAGKSDLALRCLELGFALVADDRTQLWTCQGGLYGAAPAPIAGLIEGRGLGILPAPARAMAKIRLLVECRAPNEPIERLPEQEARTLQGVAMPCLRLHALEASAPVKLRWALSHVGA